MLSASGTSGVAFETAYDQTKEGNAGKLIVDGVATIEDNFTAGNVYLKADLEEGESADVQFKDNVTVTGEDNVYTAESLTIDASGKSFAVVSGGKANVGTVDLQSGSLSVSGSANGTIVSSTLTVATLKTATDTTATVGANGLMVLTGADSVNAGTISVASGSDAKVKNGLNVAEGAVLTNNGTVSGDGTLTIDGKLVNAKAEKAQNGATVGAAKTASGTGTLAVTKTGSVTNDADSVINVNKLTVAAGGTVENSGYVAASTLDLTGSLLTSLTVGGKGDAKTPAYKFDTITLNEGAALNVVTTKDEAKVLETFYTDADGVKTVKVHNGVWNFNGGDVQLNGTAIRGADYNIEVGATAGQTALEVSFGADYEFGNVTVADKASNEVKLTATKGATLKFKNVDLTTSQSGSLSINGGASVTTENLTLSGSNVSADVSSGSLTVAGTLKASKEGAIVLNADGELNVDVTGLYEDGKYTTETSTVVANAVTANNGSKVTITGLDGKTLDIKQDGTLSKFTKLVSGHGQLDLGNVTLQKDGKALVSEGKVAYADVNGLANIVVDELESATVTDVAGAFTNGGSFGALQMKENKDATVSGSTTLQLNGTGDLVTFTDDDKKVHLKNVTIGQDDIFTVGGEGEATIGSVKAEVQSNQEVSGTVFNILEGKTLTVVGDVSVATLNVNGTTKIADVAATEQNPNPSQYDVKVGTLKVGTAGSYATNGKTTLTSGTVLGTATFADLAVTNTLSVGDTDHAGHATIGNLISGTVTFDPEFDKDTQTIAIEKASTGAVLASESGATTNVRDAAIVGIGAGASESEAVAAFTVTGWGLGARNHKQGDGSILNKDAELVKSVVAVNTLNADTQKHETFGGKLNVGDTTNQTAGNVKFGADSMLIVDATKVDATGATQIFGQSVAFAGNAELVVTNIGNGDKIAVGEFADTDSRDNFQGKLEDVAFTGDILMNAGLVTDSTTSVSSIAVGMIDKAEVVDELGDLPGLDAAYAMFETRANLGSSSSVAFNNWLYSSANQTSYQGIRDAAKDVAGLGATTGVQTLTMDAVNQMADTVAARTSILAQRGQGVNVWADVNGGKFEAKTLFDGAGYSSDIYSGVLGLDYQFSCNAVLGAALTIGTADTDSKNTAFASSTDSDLVGFSVYASKTFADIWNVSADIGYLQASNEVSTSGYGVAYKFDQDTDAFTVGVRGEVLTKAGAVNVVPHVGLRFTQLSTDSANALYRTDVDDMNVFQMPVGVALSADFETSGWTIAPKFDLSVVPTFGDKDAELKLGLAGVAATATDSVRVIDSNPVQAQLGINATNGAWGFGLNYKLGVGSEDRMNNSFNANVRYAF